MIKQLHSALQSVKMDKIDGKSAKPGTSHETFRAAIKKIDIAVNKYEECDQIDSWNVNFTAGEYYGNKTFTEIKKTFIRN